jgi:hypothetical protein
MTLSGDTKDSTHPRQSVGRRFLDLFTMWVWFAKLSTLTLA